MNELIKLNQTKIGNESVQTVNARELHVFLESKQDFSTWIKKKLERLRLQVDKDYVIVPQKNGTIDKNGNKKVSVSLEYFITLDTAKHIAMMENTDRGFEVRDYFIECEKQLREAIKPQPARIVGATEDKLNTIILALQHTSLSDVAKETYIITSVETLTGVYLGYRPQLERKTYTATQIGEQLGISAYKVGKLTNSHNLKTDKYGMYALDKDRGHDKQVETFRYYENVITVLKAILESKEYCVVRHDDE